MATHTLPGTDTLIDDSRFEMVNGQLSERPIPNTEHSRLVGACYTLLRPLVKPLGYVVQVDWSLRPAMESEDWMTPDVLVVKRDAAQALGGHVLPPCLLAIEILSPGQSFQSMNSKAFDLLRWGVENVWVINPLQRTCMIANRDTARLVFLSEKVLRAKGADGAEIVLNPDEIFDFD